MRTTAIIIALLLGICCHAQESLPPAPCIDQQPITQPLKPGTRWGIGASCVIGGLILFTPKPASNVYVGLGIIAAGTTVSLWLDKKPLKRKERR